MKSDTSVAEQTCRAGKHPKFGPGRCVQCKREADIARRERMPVREREPGNSNSHLDAEDIRAIRRAVLTRGQPVVLVARHYGISDRSVYRIVNREAWKDVE